MCCTRSIRRAHARTVVVVAWARRANGQLKKRRCLGRLCPPYGIAKTKRPDPGGSGRSLNHTRSEIRMAPLAIGAEVVSRRTGATVEHRMAAPALITPFAAPAAVGDLGDVAG